MGRLTTHVLDTANGAPAAGLAVDLFVVEGERRTFIKSVVTNDDGRCDGPLLEGQHFVTSTYELVFHVGDYFATRAKDEPEFLSEVPVRFGVSDAAAHYHVPLLVSPFGYTTYRGS